MKKALVTGICGQDGRYIGEQLLAKGYQVFGLTRQDEVADILSGVTMLRGDLEDHDSLRATIDRAEPDEIYNLAGVSDLKTAYEFPEKTQEVNYRSVGVLLEKALTTNPKVRFLQASSSEIFLPASDALNENSERDWKTENPYARAKMMTDRDVIKLARTTRGAFACSAILFNHESPYSPEKFVTRKITRTLVKIKFGLETCLSIGNVDEKRDWGFAGDYAEAMIRMLAHTTPEDLVIATGKLHSIRDVIEITCGILDIPLVWSGEGIDLTGLDGSGRVIVQIDPTFFKPAAPYPKCGNIEKAKKTIGWEPKVDFETLIEMMVQADLTDLETK